MENEMELALFLKKHGIRPRQVQDFLPSPMDVATSIYYTGKDPISGDNVYVAKKRLKRESTGP